jgi:hypothetical protein
MAAAVARSAKNRSRIDFSNRMNSKTHPRFISFRDGRSSWLLRWRAAPKIDRGSILAIE